MGRLWNTVLGVAVLCGLGNAMAVTLRADEPGFRVDNKVYFNDDKAPVSASTTIFHDGTIYDFMDQPAETFVFDRPGQRFVLLNTSRRVCTQIPVRQVTAFTEQLQKNMEGHKDAQGQFDPFLKFLARPSFERHAEDDTLTFQSPWITYRVTTSPAPNRLMAARYREFSDWFAQLSPMLAPSGKPPFSRMAVNAVLAEGNLLPQTVDVTVTPKKGLWPKRITYRSEHQWIDRLNAGDLDHVNQARQFMSIFNPVSFEQYSKNVN